MPPAVTGRRRFVAPLVVLTAVAVGLGAFWVGRSTSSAGATRSATVDESVDVAPVVTTSTTTTVPKQVAGSRLGPGPNTVYVIGDSVTLATEHRTPLALAGWTTTFDAKESRRIDQGIDILAARPSPVARVLVVHLCTNWWGTDYHAAATRLLAAAKGVERVVWVTCVPWRHEVEQANAVIRALPDEFPFVVVADWEALADQPGYTAGDHLHLNTPGVDALASLIAGSVGPPPSSS